MTALAFLRMFGALGVVLALLAGALWAVRRYDIRLPGRLGGAGVRTARLELIERLSVDPKRSLLLVRRDAVEMLVLMTPEGNLLLTDARTAGPPILPLSITGAGNTPTELRAQSVFDAEDGFQGDPPEGVRRSGGSSTAFLSNMARFQRLTNRRLARHD